VQIFSGDTHIWGHLPCHRYRSGTGHPSGTRPRGSRTSGCRLPPGVLQLPRETQGWVGAGGDVVGPRGAPCLPRAPLPAMGSGRGDRARPRGSAPRSPPEPSPAVPAGVLSLPYAEIREPFEAWYNLTGGKSRIEYYGGGSPDPSASPAFCPRTFGCLSKALGATTMPAPGGLA